MGLADTMMSVLAGRSWRVASQAAAQPSKPLEYPARIELGRDTIDLRPMTGYDRAAMLDFARSLPSHDLLFLRRDITQPEVVEDWVRDIQEDRYVTIVALRGTQIVGYATVASEGIAWTRHVAELRVLVSDTSTARQILMKKDIPARVDDVVAVQMEDKPGQLADLLERLMETGIKIKYGYALAGMDSGKAIMIFRFDDNDKAIKILTEKKVQLMDRESFNKLAATG